jgi:hypothetical protein
MAAGGIRKGKKEERKERRKEERKKGNDRQKKVAKGGQKENVNDVYK